MSNQSELIKQKTWSLQKRILVSAASTGGILLVAIIVGTFLYSLGTRLHIFNSQSLKGLTLASLAQDSGFLKMVQESQNSIDCKNEGLGIELQYPEYLVDTATESAQKCTSFAPKLGNKEVISINLLAIDKSALIDKIARESTQVTIDTLRHSKYAGSAIRANRSGLPYAAYVLELSPQKTLLVEVMPSLGQFETAGFAITQSITLP